MLVNAGSSKFTGTVVLAMNKQLRVSYVCIVILGLEHFLFCLLQKFSFLVKVVYVILFSKVALMKYLAVWCLSVSGS